MQIKQRLIGLSLAALLTFGMLGAIDQLAQPDAGAATAAAAIAAPRA
jgi:hypothetical protein